MNDLKLHLVDFDPDFCDAFRNAFKRHPEVSIRTANILDVATNCIVSPANSSGYMDGGIDAAYRKFFGSSFETKVREKIQSLPSGTLPIGSAMIVATKNTRIPLVIIAPTMIMPEYIDASISKRTMSSVLRVYESHKKYISDIFCPGLGTGVGSVLPIDAANAMAEAYSSWKYIPATVITNTWIEIVPPKSQQVAEMDFFNWKRQYEENNGRLNDALIRIDTIRGADKNKLTRYMFNQTDQNNVS